MKVEYSVKQVWSMARVLDFVSTFLVYAIFVGAQDVSANCLIPVRCRGILSWHNISTSLCDLTTCGQKVQESQGRLRDIETMMEGIKKIINDRRIDRGEGEISGEITKVGEATKQVQGCHLPMQCGDGVAWDTPVVLDPFSGEVESGCVIQLQEIRGKYEHLNLEYGRLSEEFEKERSLVSTTTAAVVGTTA